MKLFRRGAGGPPNDDAAGLVGVWQLVRSDDLGHQDAGLDLRADGRMLYAIPNQGKWAIMRLTYRVEGATIVSNQPSAPREDRTKFSLTPDGTLVLEQEGSGVGFVGARSARRTSSGGCVLHEARQ